MSKVIPGQEDIFSLFGIVDDYAEQQKKEAEERAQKVEELRKQVATQRAVAAENKSEDKEKPAETFAVNENTTIRVFGETLEITSYFSSEELAEGLLVKKKDEEETSCKPIDGEIIRKRIEEDYPELIKGMTEIVYLKEKNMVVAFPKAKKKGNCMETSSDSEGVSFPSNRIPFRVLGEFISLANMYGEQHLEIHSDIYFKNGQFFLDVPGQQVHAYWCEVTESAQSIVERVEDAVKVCEIHSHHSMPPRPSGQDNRSERFPGMIYAIVGYTNKPFPDITIRRFISEEIEWIPLEYSMVFEDPFVSLPLFDMKKIEVVL